MEAARCWARGEGFEVLEADQAAGLYVDEDLLAEARAMGLDTASLATSGLASSGDQVLYLLPENVESLDLFVGLRTQWQWVAPAIGEPRRTGLDYAGVEAALRLHGIRGARRSELFRDVRVMESAAIEVWNG